MKLKTLLFLLMFAPMTVVFGQQKSNDVRINWSDVNDGKTRYANVDDFYETSNGYFATKSIVKGIFRADYYLDKYDDKLNFVSTLEISGMYDDDRDYEQMVEAGGDLYIFSSLLDKASNKKTIYFETVNTANNSFNNDKVKITTITVDKKSQWISFNVYKSPNENNILVTVDYPYKKDESEKIGLFVFNNEMEQIWSQEDYELEHDDKKFRIKNYLLSDASDVYLMGYEYISRKEAKENNEIAHLDFELICFTENGESVATFPIEMKDIFVNDYTVEIGKDGLLYGGGFYSNVGNGHSDGAFVFAVNPKTENLTMFNKKEFDLDFLKEGNSEKVQDKMDKKDKKGKDIVVYNLLVDDVVYGDDGSIKIIGEQYHYYQTCTTDSKGNTRCTDHYVYNDIIVVNINDKDEMDWITKIPKRQHTINDGGIYSSYVLAENQGELYFIFNDNLLNYTEFDEAKGYKNMNLKKKLGVVAVSKISTEGEMTREIIYTLAEDPAYLKPYIGTQISDNEIIVFARLTKGFKIGSILLE